MNTKSIVVDLWFLIVICKIQPIYGQNPDLHAVLPSRTAIEDMGFRLMDTLLKLGRNELAKSVQKQQMDRLAKGLEDRAELMKNDQVDLVAKSGQKIVEILKENGISMVDFFRKMRKIEFSKDGDAKSLLDRLRLEVLPNVVSNVIHGREMEESTVQEPQLHPVTDQQQHHFIDQEQEVLNKMRVPEFQSVPELRFMTPPTMPNVIPSTQPTFPVTTQSSILSIRNSFPNLEEFKGFLNQFPLMNSDNPSMSRVTTTGFNVAPTPEGLKYDFNQNPLMNPTAERPNFGLSSMKMDVPTTERPPKTIALRDQALNERYYQRIVGLDQDLLMKSSLKRPNFPFPTTERPPKAIALKKQAEPNESRSFSYSDLLLKELEPLLKSRRAKEMVENREEFDDSLLKSTNPPIKWTEQTSPEDKRPRPSSRFVDVKPIPEEKAKFHRLKIKEHQLKDLEGNKRKGWEVNNDPDYAEYEVRHPVMTSSGTAKTSNVNKRRFL